MTMECNPYAPSVTGQVVVVIKPLSFSMMSPRNFAIVSDTLPGFSQKHQLRVLRISCLMNGGTQWLQQGMLTDSQMHNTG